MRDASLLDPAVLVRIGALDLVARRIVEGTMVGLHRSASHGVGREFAQYRPYIAGDDMRALDWRVFGRTDRYYLRQFEAETNLHAILMVDASASMRFGTAEASKFQVARMLVAALASLLVGQGDRVGLWPIAGDARCERIPPRGGKRHLHAVLHALERASPDGKGSVVDALGDCLGQLRRRGPIIVFSDFYEEADAIAEAGRRLERAGFELAFFHCLDPVERRLELSGDLEFVGLEGDGHVTADVRRVRVAYMARLEAHLASLRQSCARAGIDYVDVDTSSPLDEALIRFLSARRLRLRGR